jgi:hypothetical protein
MREVIKMVRRKVQAAREVSKRCHL